MKKRTWKKYLNKQKYSECQVVTAINAYYFLTGKTIKQDSDEYEELVDISYARYGSAICIEKIYKKLGIKIIWSGDSLLDFKLEFEKSNNSLSDYMPKYKKGKIPLPLEFNCWHKKTGFHSTLIVDHIIRCGVYRIANFRVATSLEGWIFEEDLYQFGTKQTGKKFKLFGLEK